MDCLEIDFFGGILTRRRRSGWCREAASTDSALPPRGKWCFYNAGLAMRVTLRVRIRLDVYILQCGKGGHDDLVDGFARETVVPGAI